MEKPCRLEMNTTGAWKLLGKFDAADDESADNIMNAAAGLVDALNEASGGSGTLRVSTDEPHPAVLMRYEGHEHGWRDPLGGPA